MCKSGYGSYSNYEVVPRLHSQVPTLPLNAYIYEIHIEDILLFRLR